MSDKIVEILSDRLFIRSFEKSDFRNFCKINMDNTIMKYFDGGAKTLEQAKKRFDEILEHQEKYGFSYWGVFLKDTKEFIGQCGLYHNYDMSLNFCYGFLEEFQHKGYASEACSAILNYVFENFGFQYITAMSHIDNKSSMKLLNKLGFRKLGEKILHSGTNVFLYSLAKKDFCKKEEL